MILIFCQPIRNIKYFWSILIISWHYFCLDLRLSSYTTWNKFICQNLYHNFLTDPQYSSCESICSQLSPIGVFLCSQILLRGSPGKNAPTPWCSSYMNIFIEVIIHIAIRINIHIDVVIVIQICVMSIFYTVQNLPQKCVNCNWFV